MKVIKESDWLVSENKNGNEKFWKLSIIQDGEKYYTQTCWYQISKNGKKTKIQYSDPYFAAPTNIGRSNERNSKVQAEFEYESIIKKQLDSGFHEVGGISSAKLLPMLAHKFKDHKRKVEFPVYVQPKLNGMRMLFDGNVGWSRGNKEVIPEVIQHLKFDTKGYILDGELMLPNNVLLQESMSAIKRYQPGKSDKLVYHVYDIVDSELPYIMRHQIISDLLQNAPENVKFVKTVLANSEAEVSHLHTLFMMDGFEGTMIRMPEIGYEIGKRSYSLLKLKDFVDAEYKIVDLVDGEGSDRGLAIFILDAGNGQTFNCRPEGTQENRAELYKNRKNLIGKFLTVRYFELSRDGVPIFPVGVSVREYGEF